MKIDDQHNFGTRHHTETNELICFFLIWACEIDWEAHFHDMNKLDPYKLEDV